MSTKQLYEKTSEGMKEVSPLVSIEDIYSKLSDTSLEALVSLFNHVKCEWKGSVSDTRRTVPLFLRRSGLFITYNNGAKYITEFFSAGTDQITTEGWVKDSNWTSVPDEDYISAGVKPGVGTIGYEQLNDNLKQLFREKVNVTNFPDDEDIASVDNMLKLKDREADAAKFQSKGYVILRKNLRLVNGVVKNILTQDMISKPNTIYVIRYDFTLGEDITIPDNCVLEFDGGSVSGGIIISNHTKVINLPKDTEIVGKIYNTQGNEITTRGDIIKRNCKLYYTFNVYGNADTDVTNNGVYRLTAIARNLGITDSFIIIGGELNGNSYYTNYYDNEANFMNVIRKNGVHPYALKFSMKNPSNIEQAASYVEFVTNTVSKFKNLGLDFEAVYIVNELSSMYRGAYNSYTVELANNIVNLGYIPRISFDRRGTWINSADELLTNGVCFPDLNYYPPLSKLDENSTFKESMVDAILEDFNGYETLYGKYKLKDLFFSECGITKGTRALRNPAFFRPEDTGPFIFDEGIIIFWTAMVKALNKLPINNVCLWFLEQISASPNDYVANTLYNLFNKELK